VCVKDLKHKLLKSGLKTEHLMLHGQRAYISHPIIW